jgi:putative membrane protein
MRREILSRWGVLVAMALLVVGAPASAETTAATPGQPRAGAAGDERGGGDQQIVMELHHANQNEIHMAKMAQERATSAKVKDYAATLLKDHAAADQKLLAYARRKNMNMDELRRPYDALPHGALAMAELASSRGAEFNHNFALKMVADHQKAIDEATTAERIARDPQLEALIEEMLPALRKHQATAEALAASEPHPPAQAVQPPGEPSGVSRTHTGIDTHPGVIP